MYQLLIGGLCAFILSAIFGKLFIPVLRRLKFGQEIREEGPKWHAKKSGTPTMGGFIFIISLVISCAICYTVGVLFGVDIPAGAEITMLLVISIAFGVIGFIIASVIAIPVSVYHEVGTIVFTLSQVLIGILFLVIGGVVGYKLGEK